MLYYSPEQIAARLKQVSVQSIYNYLYQNKVRYEQFKPYLRRKGKAYRHCKAPNIKEGDRRYKRSIKQRPSYVESRKTQGHWEGDTIISRKDKQALLTLVERKTGLVLIGRLNQRTAAETRDMIIKLLTPFKKKVKSITI